MNETLRNRSHVRDIMPLGTLDLDFHTYIIDKGSRQLHAFYFIRKLVLLLVVDF